MTTTRTVISEAGAGAADVKLIIIKIDTNIVEKTENLDTETQSRLVQDTVIKTDIGEKVES